MHLLQKLARTRDHTKVHVSSGCNRIHHQPDITAQLAKDLPRYLRCEATLPVLHGMSAINNLPNAMTKLNSKQWTPLHVSRRPINCSIQLWADQPWDDESGFASSAMVMGNAQQHACGASPNNSQRLPAGLASPLMRQVRHKERSSMQ